MGSFSVWHLAVLLAVFGLAALAAFLISTVYNKYKRRSR